MASPLAVKYETGYFVKDEKAMRLYNSRGSKKNRLYLADYNGVPGAAKIAVAAEIALPKKGKDLPELGLIDRQFYFLLKNKTTFYKINKSSFIKRMGIKESDIINDKNGYPVKDSLSKILEQIGSYQKRLTEFLKRVTMLNLKSGAPNRQLETFENQFINCLVNDPINRIYNIILFYNTNQVNLQNLRDYNWIEIPKPDEIKAAAKSSLIIRYDQASADACHTQTPSPAAPNNIQGEDVSFRMHGVDAIINSPQNPNGAVVVVTVTPKEYKDIMAGKPLSSRLKTALEAN